MRTIEGGGLLETWSSHLERTEQRGVHSNCSGADQRHRAKGTRRAGTKMNTFQFSYDCIIDCGTRVKNLVCPSIENYCTRVLNISLP